MTEAQLRRCGLLTPARPVARLPEGSLIAGFFVEGRPVPWSAPTTTRTGHSFKNPRLVSWQKLVGDLAYLAMRPDPPYSHPVRLDLIFYLTVRGGSRPDTSNLGKALEDALQGKVIVNDKQVCDIRSRRVIGTGEGVMIQVFAMEEPK